MVNEVKDKLDQIEALCRKHHVKALYLFGSALNGQWSPESDIDLLYEMDHAAFLKPGTPDYAANFFALEEALEKLMGRKVDLVRRDFNHPMPFLKNIGAAKKLIYAE